MEDIRALHAQCAARQVFMVVAVLDDHPPPAITMDEFQSILLRDIALDDQHVLHLTTPAPTQEQVRSFKKRRQ